MTDTALLREAIKKSGFKLSYIAEKLDLTAYGLQRKIDGLNEFKASEINKLCDLLGITDLKAKEKIFFAKQRD